MTRHDALKHLQRITQDRGLAMTADGTVLGASQDATIGMVKDAAAVVRAFLVREWDKTGDHWMLYRSADGAKHTLIKVAPDARLYRTDDAALKLLDTIAWACVGADRHETCRVRDSRE